MIAAMLPYLDVLADSAISVTSSLSVLLDS
jgi:hypothetical protein